MRPNCSGHLGLIETGIKILIFGLVVLKFIISIDGYEFVAGV